MKTAYLGGGAGGGGGGTNQVLIDGADTTPDFLAGKIVAGSGITLAVLNPGANEQLQISETGTINITLQAVGAAGLALTTPTLLAPLNTWISLPVGAFFYNLFNVGEFSFDTTTGIATYIGSGVRNFWIQMSATLASAGANDSLELTIAINGYPIGTTDFIPSGGAATSPTPGLGAHITYARILLLTPGDTVQGAMRNRTGPNALTATHYNVIALPI